VRLSRTSTALRRAAPAPGADTDVILKEYGYTAAEIAALKASGAAGVDPDTTKQVKGRSK
jgi:crotonobetainyl-CoA:carnitine CoA-transferase CaiB-like acyl-CoA transferase